MNDEILVGNVVGRLIELSEIYKSISNGAMKTDKAELALETLEDLMNDLCDYLAKHKGQL